MLIRVWSCLFSLLLCWIEVAQQGRAVEGAAVSQACGKPGLTPKAAVCRQRGSSPPPRAGQQADIYPRTAEAQKMQRLEL